MIGDRPHNYHSERKRRIRQMVATMKVERGCATCGYRADSTKLYCVLPDTEPVGVSRLISDGFGVATVMYAARRSTILCATHATSERMLATYERANQDEQRQESSSADAMGTAAQEVPAIG